MPIDDSPVLAPKPDCHFFTLLDRLRRRPEYQKPIAQAPPTFKELAPGNDQWKVATPSDEMLKGKWWEIFGDPQLNRLEEMVAVNNFSVKQAEAQFRQSRALVLGSRASLLPDNRR